MNILMLSTDRSILNQDESISADAARRMKIYADAAGKITMVVHTKSGGYRQRQCGKNLRIIPTNGVSSLHSYIKMFLIADDLCQHEPFDLVVSQDPFATGSIAFGLKLWQDIPYSVCVFSSFFNNPHWLKENWYNPILHEIGKEVVRNADSIRVECQTEKRIIEEILHAN